MLSGLPVDDPNTAVQEENFVFNTIIFTIPMTAKQIEQCSNKDTVLTKGYESIMLGWPHHGTD